MTQCVTGIRVGRPVNPSKEQEKAQYRLLFGPDSTEPLSHIFETLEGGFLVQAFGLDSEEKLIVRMVAGHGMADYDETVYINGQRIEITAMNNVVFLPWPFRYRLQATGPQAIGSFTVYAVPVPYEYNTAIAASGRFA